MSRHRLLRRGAVATVVRAGVARRKLHTLVLALVTLAAVTSAVVAGSLLAASAAPFDSAFARQRGAQLALRLDAGAAAPDRLAGTGRLPGVTATAGPFPSATLTPELTGHQPGPQLYLVGRPAPDGPVDDLTMVLGHWPTAPGQVVVSTSYNGPDFALGSTLTTTAGSTLTVVGLASSITGSADAWALPATVTALPDGGRQEQQLYRYTGTPDQARIDADRAALTAALPAGAALGTQSYLDAKLVADENGQSIAPFLLAFGGLGLAMSVIIVASVVSGAVSARLSRIGVLKALGFTPGQVVRAYLMQALLPAALGALLGVLAGNVLAVPLLREDQQTGAGTSLTVSWWVDALVGGGTLLVVALAALLPALRAGRLSAVAALSVGRSPRSGRGRWAHRLTARLPLPRPVRYGLAGPFARPLRSAALVAAVAAGTVAATFATGLTASANAIGGSRDVAAGYSVTVDPLVFPAGGPGQGGPGGGADPVPLDTAQEARLVAAVKAQPGTRTYFAVTGVQGQVSGVSGTVQATLYSGDSLATGPAMVAGHWLTGPGQVVAAQHFLNSTGHRLGDTLTVTAGGTSVRAVIVGTAFASGNGGMGLSADLPELQDGPTAPPVWTYQVALKPGTDQAAYLNGLNAALAPLGVSAAPRQSETPHLVLIVDAMAAMLTAMLLLVAGLGVLNAVLLDTREKVRDLGICKAVGMTPGQVIALVLTSVVGVGLVGGALGVPGGMALHALIMPMVGHGMDSPLPTVVTAVYHAPELLLLGAGGLAVTLLGAALPAGWAARARTAQALRAE
ncbi:FtsX-like permease family protein [Kitasatospora viridis]|uniref:Putative ABC transport system permease protein n=1 Tax=Kitasatospora viridis TaxID=281105 RepID=A0A561SEY3_9ACTN|nr:FtsX-like permease family protein [Kitasatospora viridis]TWF73426.1 putative ABC transport system permease protein [Kitasatospora viridis]